MIKSFKLLAMAFPLVFILQGCSRTQEPFLLVQMCLIDQGGVEQFLEIMREVAKAENLKFIDDSLEAAESLRVMGADKALNFDSAFTIHVGIENENKGNMFVLGGNIGLPPYQVAVGFAEGNDAAKAHRLSDRLVKAFSQLWHIETVPQGKGSLPMKSCGG